MNKDNIRSLILGLGISLVISGVIYFKLFQQTFDLFGLDGLRNPEARHAKILYTALITSLAILVVAIVLQKVGRKYFAKGFVIPALIGLMPILSVGPTFINKSNYYETFDEDKWMSQEKKQEKDRIKMARHLVKTRALIGLTKEEVIKKLGTDYYYFREEMNYKVLYGCCGLGIAFENGKVVDYSVWAHE